MRSSPSPRCLTLGLIALAAIGSGTARAQSFDPFDEVMPPRAVVWRLNDRGFTDISRPRFDGRAYVVEAESPNGGRVRLILDPRDGAVVGRIRLSEPPFPPLRVDRPRGPYGWTDEDAAPRRREADRMIPPGDIPYGTGRDRLRDSVDLDPVPPLPGSPLRSGMPRRTEPADPNALGLNPDAGKRSGDPARRISRLNPPAKPNEPRMRDRGPDAAKATPSTPPPAPLPTLRPAEAPAAQTEAPVAAVRPPAQDIAPATAGEAKPIVQSWKDPPADGRRPVRVIDGATIVPGAGDKTTTAQD